MKTVLLILFFVLPALGQDRSARPLDSVRVEIASGEGSEAAELARLVRAELRARGDVVFPSRSAVDLSVVIAASRLDDDVQCGGFVAATLVVDGRGKSKLWLDSAGDLEALGKMITRSLARKFDEREK